MVVPMNFPFSKYYVYVKIVNDDVMKKHHAAEI